MPEKLIVLPRFFKESDVQNIPRKQQRHWADWLKHTIHDTTCWEVVDSIVLHHDDVVLLRQWTENSEPFVRQGAVQALCEFGPVNWEDLEAWLCDENEDVVRMVIWSMENHITKSAAWSLCESDKKKCAVLLCEVVKQKASMAVAIQLRMLADEDEWLEIIWPKAEEVLDAGGDLTAIIVGFFEDVIKERNWGPDDPHLCHWFEPEYELRQYALLKVAAWMGLNEGRLREIVERLTQSSHAEIVRIACGVLKGSIGYGDF